MKETFKLANKAQACDKAAGWGACARMRACAFPVPLVNSRSLWAAGRVAKREKPAPDQHGMRVWCFLGGSRHE